MSRIIHNPSEWFSRADTNRKTQFSGFTIIELTIAIAILGIIIAATTSIFVTGLKNYQSNFQKSTMQKEINFTIDSIANDVKSGVAVAPTHESFTSSSETLIISLPALDSENNFIYSGDVLEVDHIVYYLSNGSLRKYVFGNSLGKRSLLNGIDREIISDVSSVNFQYTPGIDNASQVKTTISLYKKIGKSNLSTTEERIANLRNKQ